MCLSKNPELDYQEDLPEAGVDPIGKSRVKVHIFWEGHKILRNLHLKFDYSTHSQI